MVKTMYLTHKKRTEAAKNVLYRKAMEDLRNRINVKQVNNEKDYIKYTSKPNYMPYKIFDKNYGDM